MTQTELADALGQYQSFVARVESGQRRVDVIEFLDIAGAVGFDPKKVIGKLQSLALRICATIGDGPLKKTC